VLIGEERSAHNTVRSARADPGEIAGLAGLSTALSVGYPQSRCSNQAELLPVDARGYCRSALGCDENRHLQSAVQLCRPHAVGSDRAEQRALLSSTWGDVRAPYRQAERQSAAAWRTDGRLERTYHGPLRTLHETPPSNRLFGDRDARGSSVPGQHPARDVRAPERAICAACKKNRTCHPHGGSQIVR
jgi:hypothetical protein